MTDSRPPTVMCPRCGCQAHYIGDLDAYQCHGCQLTRKGHPMTTNRYYLREDVTPPTLVMYTGTRGRDDGMWTERTLDGERVAEGTR